LGRIHKLKGLENLLYAWKKINLKYKDWQLKIIGTDVGYKKRSNYLRKLKLLSQKLKLINIDFVDPIYGNEKFQTLADAQIMILPSFTENFGMTVAEALSVGTPVITTNQTPWHQLDSKNAGWCIDIGVEATINCLEEALSKNVDELNEMGTRGIEWMQQDFSWPTIINKLILTYGWLNDKKKKKCEWIKID
jgi:glycosyltransferase involved in cell wall biosynthesis